MAWAKNDTVTLSSSNAELDAGGVTSYIFNTMMMYTSDTSGSADVRVQFNNDSSNYAWRWSEDGGSDLTSTSESRGCLISAQGIATPVLSVSYFINIADEEKLVIAFSCEQSTAGASTAPRRAEMVTKWVNTSVQISDISINLTGAVTFPSDANVSILGTD
jgi:hypothetical protein